MDESKRDATKVEGKRNVNLYALPSILFRGQVNDVEFTHPPLEEERGRAHGQRVCVCVSV
jgi:hypothetical protein